MLNEREINDWIKASMSFKWAIKTDLLAIHTPSWMQITSSIIIIFKWRKNFCNFWRSCSWNENFQLIVIIQHLRPWIIRGLFCFILIFLAIKKEKSIIQISFLLFDWNLCNSYQKEMFASKKLKKWKAWEWFHLLSILIRKYQLEK